MKISTKGRYALRVMIDLAVYGSEEYIPLKAVSERQNITVKYLEQIISPLSKAGYLKSLRGNNGGYRLTCAPKEYSVGDILRTMEGSLSPISCVEDVPNQCPRCDKCSTLSFWVGLDKVINEYVDNVTLGDLIENMNEMNENDYSI